jgi:SAM-dependent methyltransferase
MKKYTQSTYGDRISEIYDLWYSEFEQSIIQTLARFAQGGRALELGIGTGRIAIPLHQEGIEVYGIDASQAMLAKLKSKPGGEDIHVSIGNLADVDVEGHFNLIFVVANTIFALTAQNEQVSCFKNVADHLTPSGVFVVEAFVPNLARFTDRQTVRVIDMDENGVRLEVSRLDLVNQQITGQQVFLTEEGSRLFPVKIRYAWPSEMDLLARHAGMTLQHRWSSWEGDPFTNDSTRHISVYGHAQ